VAQLDWIADHLVDISLQMTFLFCVSFAIINDFRTLLIPNWISLALVAAFAVFAVFNLALGALGGHLLVMAVVLIVSIVFFLAGWMGGGDVKFLSAVALWMGPGDAAPFVVLMALLGATLAITLLVVRRYALLVDRRVQKLWFVGRVVQLAEAGQCPYGIAIGGAALIAAPGVFGLA
jgi:prepilin peptidase CpaA